MDKILTVRLTDSSDVNRIKRAIDLMSGVERVEEGTTPDDSDIKETLRAVQDVLYRHENPNDFNCPLRQLRDEIAQDLGEEYAVKQAWNPRDALIRQEMIPPPVEPAEQPELPDIGVWVQDGESRGELAEAIRTFHTVSRVEEET